MRYSIRYTASPDVLVFYFNTLLTGLFCNVWKSSKKVKADDPNLIKNLFTISGVDGVSVEAERKGERIDIYKLPSATWDAIVPFVLKAVQQLRPDEPLQPIKKVRKPISAKKKIKVAEAIENGLHYVKEDHEVFVSTRSGPVCGCVLTIAAAGLHGYFVHSMIAIEDELNQGASGTQLLAGMLKIPEWFASQLDKLHRVDMVSASEIAGRLRRGEI